MSILDEIGAYAKIRCAANQKIVSLDEIKAQAYATPKGEFGFEKALRKPHLSFICECKKASPSKGLIDPVFDYLKIAKEYEVAGADCVSVLTEPKWFLGNDSYLKDITKEIKLPCIRKDFIIDEYMIYEAKLLNASAVLLIVSLLSSKQLNEYLQICDELGLSALVEAHDEEEIQIAIQAHARMIGVNNRNLKNFSVDNGNSKRLRQLVPSDIIFVSESGIKTREDVVELEKIGVDAVLIGETLMRATNKKQMLAKLRGYDE